MTLTRVKLRSREVSLRKQLIAFSQNGNKKKERFM